MGHEAIGQGFDFGDGGGSDDVVLAIDYLKLICEFAVRAGELSEGINKWNGCGEAMDGNSVMNVNAGNVVATQNVLQYSLAQDDANNLLLLSLRQFFLPLLPSFAFSNYN